MTLREQAAQIAQEKGRAARLAQHQAWEKQVEARAQKITDGTGVTATYVDEVDMACLEYASSGFQRQTEVLATRRAMVFQVDDVEILVFKPEGRVGSETTYAFAHQDASQTPMYYANRYHSLHWSNVYNDQSAEEKVARFVTQLALERPEKHPAVILAEQQSTCPTCGRGW